MAYLALYRKYRPQTFSEVVGQDVVVRTLKNAVASDRTSHAYLFCGPRGTGKTSTAKILARAVNCEHPVDGEPCGECAACQALSGAAADIFEFDAASNSRVEQMRDLLDKVMYPPTVGKKKVYILDEVHMLSTAAFNALLKTLEEPPAFVLFILATTEPHRLPATIVSRCQRFDFKRIDPATISARLKAVLDDTGAKMTDEAIDLIARLSEGGMRDALSLADQVIGMSDGEASVQDVIRITGGADADFLGDLSEELIDGDLGAALSRIDEALTKGADAAMLARDLARYLRDMLITISVKQPGQLLTGDDRGIARLKELGEKAQKPMLTQALKTLLALDGSMRYALSPRVALETALAEIALGGGEGGLALATLERKVDALEEKVKNGVPAAPRMKKSAAASELPMEQTPVPAPKKREVPANWKGLLDSIKRIRVPLYSALVKGTCEEENDALHVYFTANEKIYAMVSQKAENLELLTRTAKEVYGRDMKVDVTVREDDPFDTARTQDAARALFGDKLTVK